MASSESSSEDDFDDGAQDVENAGSDESSGSEDRDCSGRARPPAAKVVWLGLDGAGRSTALCVDILSCL